MSVVMSAFGRSTNNESEDGNNMKKKVLETWNNLRFEMSSGTNLRKDSPIWVLGKRYVIQPDEMESCALPETSKEKQQTVKKEHVKDNFRLFLMDFYSKIWFSYRKGFPPLPGSSLTSDTGWGCMLRTAQMMIAQSLVQHFLGKKWRRLGENHTLQQRKIHREIVQYFLDEPNPKCPFSLHTLTEIGSNYRYMPGDWYGPGTVAYIMQDAMECGKGHNSNLNSVRIYVAQDCTVYKNDVVQMCYWSSQSTTDSDDKQNSVIILIPVRLGEAELNSIYIPCLKSMLSLKQSTGIIGGKPKHSLYFIGFQDDYLIYLDPHYCQQADTLAAFTNKQLENYHNVPPRKMNIAKMDPSCCLSFYCRNLDDFDNFILEANKCLSPPQQKSSSYPLCLIVDGNSSDIKLPNSPTYNNIVCPLKKDKNSEFTEINLGLDSETKKSCNSGHLTPQNSDIDDKQNSDLTNSSEEKTNFMSPRTLFSNFYQSLSKNSKSEKNCEQSLEEEFELL